jgi:uncharacterized protein
MFARPFLVGLVIWGSAKTSAMNISVSKISEEDGLRIEYVFPEGEPNLRSKDGRLIGQTRLIARATRKGAQVRLSGTVEALVGIDCARCLAPVVSAVAEPFDLLYEPAGRAETAADETELDEEDLFVVFYHDGLIDVDDLVREQVELALPMSGLCSDECRGLCPECGINLNYGECRCENAQADPRWSALLELRSKQIQ